jgi:SAM-dependent methyltransferase
MPTTHIAETTSKVAGYLIGYAKRVVPVSALPAMASAFDGVTNLGERVSGVRDDLTPPLRVRLHIGPFLDPRLYRMTGERNAAAFRELAGLQPGARFLDIGCGCGRVAAALTSYLTPRASYEGFDASKKPVEWCQKEITPRFPNFRFRTTDTFSQRYNPSGGADARRLVFPYDDDTFDFAFAGSVYTHMLPEEAANFMAETARVLKPGGVSLATFCLFDDSTLPAVRAGLTMPRLVYKYGQFQVRTLEDPAHFIAQPEGFVRGLYAEAGFSIIEPIRRGTWSGFTPESERLESYHLGGSPSHGSSQDAVIASKK